MACSSRAAKIIGGAAAGIIVVGMIGSALGGGGDRESNDKPAPAATRTESPQDAERRHKGFHCLSGWDGGHNGLNELIKARLNDPGSFEMHETKIAPVTPYSGGKHAIIVDFSAKNALGGRVRHSARGTVAPDTCGATLVSVG